MLLYKVSLVFVYFFLKILNKQVLCEEGRSLAFAIDNTGSMEDDIDQVKNEAKAILDEVLTKDSSEVKDFVLVTINDPVSDLLIQTKSPEIFQRYLNSIDVGGGGFCPEMSLTGIEKALEKSRTGSYIFVFTDASARDYYKFETVKTLCQKKQSQVIFVLTGDCGDPSSREYLVYYKIATVSSGQVIRVDKHEVKEVLKPIKVLLGGKHSVVKSEIINHPYKEVPVVFTIDEKVEYALISVSGKNVQLRVRPVNKYAPEPKSEHVMWNSNAKVLKLFDLTPGKYIAYVRGSNAISVLVYVRTDFTFEHGFSILEPNSIRDTTKQPLAGEREYLSINVTDIENSVSIQSATLLDMNDRPIGGSSSTLPLRKIKDHFYITNLLVSPTEMFKIKIQGIIKKTNQTISRISKTAITPQVVPKMPETSPHVEINEGAETYVDYGKTTTLTCMVTAHPKPIITWYTGDGTQLPSESSELEKPSYISYLKLQNIKNNDTYVCKAVNGKGGHENKIQVKVRPVFKIISVPGETTFAKYKHTIDIPCDIKSSLPITLKWFLSGRELSNTAMRPISADGSKLTLNSMDFGMEGTYTCEATLNEDPTVKRTYNTDVKMTGLVLPQVTYAKTKLKDKRFTAICRIIGTPTPTIMWEFKPIGSDEFSQIQGTDEEFIIPDVKLKDSGNYKCVARSRLGKAERTLELIVEEPPVITNTLTEYHGVVGDKVLMIPCNVTGYPDPVITWTKETETPENEFKYEVDGGKLFISNLVPNKKIIFKCEAKNTLGTAHMPFSVEISDNLDNYYDYPQHVYNILEGNPVAIKCYVENSEISPVRWYMNGILTDQNSNEYKIEKATIPNDGNYTCRIDTAEGPKSENNELFVGTLPTFRNDEQNIIDWRDYATSLDCEVNAKPREKMEWSHNGKRINSLNNIAVTDVTDWGNYTCYVSNVHGSIQRTFKVISSGCYIRKNMGKRMPFMVDQDTLTWPDGISNSDVLLEEHEIIKLSCPSGAESTNAFQLFPSKQVITAQCHTEDQLIVDGKTYRYKDLQCEASVEPSIINTHEKCAGSDTEMIRVGFAVNDFVEAYTVCYDKSANVPLYANTHKQLKKQGLDFDTSDFKWSSAPGLGNGKLNEDYTCGTSQKCCYSKGQLLNGTELPFGPAQAATFLDNLNSVAVWNPCDEDDRISWQTFANALKAESFNYDQWSSLTGASEFVRKNVGLVPRYLWKVINYIDDGTTGSTAMIYVNDKSPEPADIRCNNTCDMILTNTEKFMYCCSLAEFSQTFGIPLDKLGHDRSN